MSSIWNEAELKIPPLVTVPVSDTNFVKQLRLVLIKRQNPHHDNLQQELATSAALLSRLMARRKNSFHNMNGFKVVCKLNSALSRLLKIDVEKVLHNFFQMLPDMLTGTGTSSEVPSRNSFDYTLLRIISVHKLFQRISICCTESADYFQKLLSKNFFMDSITLLIAVIAKLWDLSQKLGNTYCDLYKKLFPFRTCFPLLHKNNQLDTFEFPKKLEAFSICKYDQNDQAASNQNTTSATLQMQDKFVQPVMPKPVLQQIEKTEDIGTAISRTSLKPVVDLSRIHNIQDVRQYFKEEDAQRKKSLTSCATKYILNHEWLAIQKLVERKIIANDHKKALSVFRKFITSKV